MKRKLWDILAWIAFAIVITYLILKALHIINSPELADIITIISGGYFVGRYAMKIDYLEKKFLSLEVEIRNIKTNINIIENELESVKSSINFIKNK